MFAGKVGSILQAVASGQAQVSGEAVMPKGIATVPFVVRVSLDDAGHVQLSHVIRRVLLRQIAILNYVVPF